MVQIFNATLGDLELFVRDETPSYSNYITDKPVEDGTNIVDHINNKPVKLRIDFVVHRKAQHKINKLKEMRSKKELFTYDGVLFSFENMGIESFDIPINFEIKDGFSTSMTLKQVRIIEKRGSVVTVGKDSVSGKEVQKDNNETPKRQIKSAEL